MNNSPDDNFDDLRRLLALKRHEQPPPGYFARLPDKIQRRIERDDLSDHSTWWEWLMARFDARPMLAGAYAFTISGLMLLGFKFSQDLQREVALEGDFGAGFIGATPDPFTFTPSQGLQNHFANPAGLITFSSTEPVFYEPLPLQPRALPVRATFTSY